MASDSDSDDGAEADSIDTNEHDVAIIDVSRYSVNSNDATNITTNDASDTAQTAEINETDESNTNATVPGDIVIELPELDTGIGDTFNPTNDSLDDIVDGLDEVILGNALNKKRLWH